MATNKWIIDPAHSSIEFKARHLMISTVKGDFEKFSGSVAADEDNFDNAVAVFEADVNSLSTGNVQRDAHLKSSDFFDAVKYPSISFVSSLFQMKKDDLFNVSGNLTMHGITQPIILQATFGGTIDDPYGNTKAGFEIEGKINRQEFGLHWSAVTETGGVVVGDEIKIQGHFELIKKKE